MGTGMTTWLAASLALGAAVVLTELTLRAWIRWRRAYYVCLPGQRLRLHIDQDTLPELDPIARFDVNSDGERGPEVPRVRRDETLYRVLVAGGSQPEGYLLDQDVNWPGRLQQLLSSPAPANSLGASRVHVGSIARSGVGSEALDLILERVLPRYPRLSAIVILVGASDVLRWLEEGAPDGPSTLVSTDELFRCHPEGPFGWTPGTLAIAEIARRADRRVRRPLRVHTQAGRWLRNARSMRARAKVIRATTPDPGPMLRHFETHLRRAVERAKAHADRVIVVRQSWFAKPEPLTPEELAHMWHGGAGQAWRQEVTTYYSIDVTARLMALLDASAVRVADRLGVDHVDLCAVLEPSLNTYYDYFHLTPSGASAVAAAVAGALVPARRVPLTGEVSSCAGLRAS
jgi:lysophospholipase L1-like esterase